MTDTREAILEQLLVIAKAIDGVGGRAFRNRDQLSETARPAIVILDGDETAEERPADGRPARTPERIAMTPEIYVIVGGGEGPVGAGLNSLRAKIIAAIAADGTLAALVGSNGSIRYDGCATDLGRGRTMQGEMGLGFTFRYVLSPAKL